MRSILVLLTMAACTSGGDTAPEDSHDTEIDTDTCPHERLERSEFDAGSLFDYCAFALSCPDTPFSGQPDCQAYVRNGWNSLQCWDTCLAGECADWVATSPNCESIDDPILAACNEMPNCR
jgi:hypothetical protein